MTAARDTRPGWQRRPPLNLAGDEPAFREPTAELSAPQRATLERRVAAEDRAAARPVEAELSRIERAQTEQARDEQRRDEVLTRGSASHSCSGCWPGPCG
jgi:hypothetical protein